MFTMQVDSDQICVDWFARLEFTPKYPSGMADYSERMRGAVKRIGKGRQISPSCSESHN